MLAYMILCGRLPFGTEHASVNVADLYSGAFLDGHTVCSSQLTRIQAALRQRASQHCGRPVLKCVHYSVSRPLLHMPLQFVPAHLASATPHSSIADALLVAVSGARMS